MKQFTKSIIYRSLSTLFLLSFFQAMALAQANSEHTITSTIIGHYRWYTQPWALVTAIALILIVIVALVPTGEPGNNSSTGKVTYVKANQTKKNI